MEDRYDVAIIGAGLAGSAAATALAKRGWKVLLLEHDLLPRHKVCGEFLSPEVRSSLHKLGIYEAVSALAPVPLHHAEITSPGGRLMRVALPGAAWGLSRYALDAALAAAAEKSGATVWTGTGVNAVTHASSTRNSSTRAASPQAANSREKDLGMREEYTLRLRTKAEVAGARRPTTVSARTILFACGRHNRLTAQISSPASASYRSQLASQHKPKRRYVGVKCHYSGAFLPSQVELFFFRGGYAGMNPVEGSRTNLCLFVTYESFQRAGKSPAALFAAVQKEQPALARKLVSATLLPDTISTVAAVDTTRVATPWHDAACIGDAVSMITPLCGDGMAMALRGAELCVPYADAFLRKEISQAEWAHGYARDWHSEFNRRITLGRLFQSAFAQPSIAELLVGFGRLIPPIASYFVAAMRGPLSPYQNENRTLDETRLSIL